VSADSRAAGGLLPEVRRLKAPTPPMLYCTHRLGRCRRVSRRPVFRSKTRPVIIPQYEHGRVAGTLASLWGNAQFDRPALDFPAFVQGVAFHDWHYGVLDTVAVGGGDPAAWLSIVRKGVAHRFDAPVTDIVAKLHIRRLLTMKESPEYGELVEEIDARIRDRLPASGASLEQLQWADRITEFCDDVAFDFCFEQPVRRTVGVHGRAYSNESTPLSYEIQAGGMIRVEPWPFSVESFSGLAVGYEEVGYPEALVPLLIPFSVQRASAD